MFASCPILSFPCQMHAVRRKRSIVVFASLLMFGSNSASAWAQTAAQTIEGVWTTGSLSDCATKFYEGRMSGDGVQFRDRAGAVDRERILSRRQNGFISSTTQSPKVPLGTQWDYGFTSDDTVRVRNLTSGSGFILTRCPNVSWQGGSAQNFVPSPSVNQPRPVDLQRWEGTWIQSGAEIKLKVLGSQISADGTAAWGTGASTRVGDFSGVATPIGDRVSFGTRQTCFVEVRLQVQNLVVEDNGSCGGLNVSFNGAYQRSLRGSAAAGLNSTQPTAQSPLLQAASPAPVPAVTTVSTNVVVSLKSDAADLRGMISLFKEMIAEQKALARPNDSADVAQQAISVLTQRMTELQGQFREATTQLSTYTTSVRPNDPDLQITARRASEMFPKIPYYIPGTTDTGEFWLEPVVSNVGELVFNLKFIDLKSKDRVRDMVELSSAQLELVRDAMQKIVGWSKTAHDNSIRKDFSRRAVCFPQQGCPEEGAKLDKSASTEVIFRVYEDGSTAGRFPRNKGRFENGYNISIESSLLLQAYLNHVLLEGKKEFDAGSRDASQLRDLFK